MKKNKVTGPDGIVIKILPTLDDLGIDEITGNNTWNIW